MRIQAAAANLDPAQLAGSEQHPHLGVADVQSLGDVVDGEKPLAGFWRVRHGDIVDRPEMDPRGSGPGRVLQPGPGQYRGRVPKGRGPFSPAVERQLPALADLEIQGDQRSGRIWVKIDLNWSNLFRKISTSSESHKTD